METQKTHSLGLGKIPDLSYPERRFLAHAGNRSREVHKAFAAHLQVLPEDDPAWASAFLDVGFPLVIAWRKPIDNESEGANGTTYQRLSDRLLGDRSDYIIDAMTSLVVNSSIPPGSGYAE